MYIIFCSLPFQRSSEMASMIISDGEESIENTEVNTDNANEESLWCFNNLWAEISRICESSIAQRAIEENLDITQLSKNDIDECGRMYVHLLKTITDVIFEAMRTPQHPIEIPWFTDSIYTKSKVVVKKLNMIWNDLAVKIRKKEMMTYPENSAPSSSLSRTLSEGEPSTSRTLDRVEAAPEKLQLVQDENPKRIPSPASSESSQDSLDGMFSPAHENSELIWRDPLESEWNEGVLEFTDSDSNSEYTPVDEAFWIENLKELDGTDDLFNKEIYLFSVSVRETLKITFDFAGFMRNQLRVINATLLEHNCFVIMPTCKSLCYQLPAAISTGVTIVVLSTISLILDQVNKLLGLPIVAEHLSGDLDDVYRKLETPDPEIKLLYVTPEQLRVSYRLQDALVSLYNRKKIARFVVVEAHCVSQRSHDFRPDYRELRQLRVTYAGVPVSAFTATATPRVRSDIVRLLRIENCKQFITSFNRPNLYYAVLDKNPETVIKEIVKLICTKYPGKSGIVYCLTGDECERMAEGFKGTEVTASAYHGGLDDNVRKDVQWEWIADRCKVICAEIAFGIGFNKEYVRFVIHHSLPKSVEGYYQETGRAGRDGERADCLLYYNYGDVKRHYDLMSKEDSTAEEIEAHETAKENLERMKILCENKTECRRVKVRKYLGEELQNGNRKCGKDDISCDNCINKDPQNLFHSTTYNIKRRSCDVDPPTLKETKKCKKEDTAPSMKMTDLQDQISDIQNSCYADLKNICEVMASEGNEGEEEKMESTVFPRNALRGMATRLPATEADMLAVPHVDRALYDKYGHRLLPITYFYAKEKLDLLRKYQKVEPDLCQALPSTSSADGGSGAPRSLTKR